MINSILAEIDTLEKENQGLKARLKEDKQSQIATENKALQDELEKSRKENSDLKKLLDQTKAELNQSESKIKSNEVLMSITDDLKNEISLLEKENAELKMTLETIGSLTTIEKTATSAPVQEERKDEQK
jgi:predicted RNase H-like nuclease (RuvC/YqgF family)